MRKIFLIIILCVISISFLTVGGYAENEKGDSPHKAMWWEKLQGDTVQCQLCPFRCVIKEGKRGQCGIRKNIDGTLYTLNYGKIVAAHIDPIEKKPFFHVLPGKYAFSIAMAGCNLHCKYCQNWVISQSLPSQLDYTYRTPQEVVQAAKANNCDIIAYTYSEPTIFYEFMYDTAKLAKGEGLFNVMISSGFINEKPLRKLCKYMDAIKIDFKGYNKEFYRKIVSGRLEPVLNTLKVVKDEGVWLEVVNLVVPTLNDSSKDFRGLCEWVKDNLGSDVPIHFSRFTPMYKLGNLSPTPVKTLEKAVRIAKEAGIKYVYLGNVPSHRLENTYCPKCGELLIKRRGFIVMENNIVEGKCKFCGEDIPGLWNEAEE